MTKREMVNELVAIGCLKESDKNYVLKNKDKDTITKWYTELIPMRKAYLETLKKS